MRSMRAIRYSLAAGVALAFGTMAGAQIPVNLSYDFTGADWQNTNWTFQDQGGWVNDTGLTAPQKMLRLTSNNNNMQGTAWMETPIVPTEDWTISYVGRISAAAGGGADGIALIFQTYGLGASLGIGEFDNAKTDGTGLGANYLAVELDSYQNAGEHVNGMERHSSLGTVYHQTLSDGGNRLEGGEGSTGFNFTWNASYDKDTTTLQYTFQRSGFTDVTVTRTNYPMASIFPGGESATVGFWAGSGTSGENHDIQSFSITGSTIPEPTSGILIVGGSLLMLGLRRMRRSD